MEMYLVIKEENHEDKEFKIFRNRKKAIKYAESEAREYIKNREDFVYLETNESEDLYTFRVKWMDDEDDEIEKMFMEFGDEDNDIVRYYVLTRDIL